MLSLVIKPSSTVIESASVSASSCLIQFADSIVSCVYTARRLLSLVIKNLHLLVYRHAYFSLSDSFVNVCIRRGIDLA